VPVDKPLAIMRDVAGGPTEYLVGDAGGRVNQVTAATGFSPPQLGGGSVFYSVRHGVTSGIYRATFGGCVYHIADGTLGQVELRGRALSALVGTHWVMLDAGGREVTRLTGAAGSWTPDGELVEPTVGGLDVFSLTGRKRSISLTGAAPLSPLGSGRELVSTVSGVQAVDLGSGKLTPTNVGGQQVLRAPSGSPDGSRVAFLDQVGAGRVLEVATGRVQPVPAPALATGFAWSHDSKWVAVQSVYGGVELEIATGRVVDSGPLLVVSW
jgi:hypothetical protein